MSAPTALIMMSDYGHDPTETAVPYMRMKEAGFTIKFATENGKPPVCDKLMLEGITQKLLGAAKSVVGMYDNMAKGEEMQHPLSWSAPDFSLEPFDLILFPGGHEKSVRQIIDSPRVHELVINHFPLTKKPNKKAIAAICHGVMVLSESKTTEGQSVLHNCVTTSLPGGFEKVAFWGTRAFLGDYYKTYGAGSEDVEASVKKILADPKNFKSSLSMSPFVIEDENYNYISARFPGDAEVFSEKIVKLVKSLRQ
ncbi:class I glutamine amidotransferase-like protein [Xylariales sp. PMI_506]|nr:class I glutamine amidotransferase-like protein [Xylariales sp. PMI_506]